MEFDYSKLRGRIVEKCGDYQTFAMRMQMTKGSLSRKLHNHVSFQQDDVERACKILDIPITEVGTYFFTLKVQGA